MSLARLKPTFYTLHALCERVDTFPAKQEVFTQFVYASCKAIDSEVPKPSNLERPLKGFKGNAANLSMQETSSRASHPDPAKQEVLTQFV